MPAINANLTPLLEFIRRHEAPKGYDQVWGKIKKQNLPPKSLTKMTINEVLAWQDSIDPLYRSEAAGAYQILEDTLRDLKARLGLKGTELYDREMQDQLAIALMRGRGLQAYLDGRLSAEGFCNNLAREWASLPLVSGPNRGKSYYAGDGLNKSLTGADEFFEIVLAIKKAPATAPVSKAVPVAIGFTAALAAAITAAKSTICAWPFMSFICGG